MDDKKPSEPVHKFCERVLIAQSKDLFLFGMHSGGELSAYVLTPDHAKQLLRALQTEINKHESAHGVLEGRLPSDPLLSPIQVQKPPEDTDKK